MAAIVAREVMIDFYVTGDADFLLVVTAKSMEDYEQSTRRVFYANPEGLHDHGCDGQDEGTV